MDMFMDVDGSALFDLDHVVTKDNKIYRVVGNLNRGDTCLGYNVYAPHRDGDRVYRGVHYRKNFIEDENLPADVLDTYEFISVANVVERHDPIESAKGNNTTFESTVWHDLYGELVTVFGVDNVGVFGSSMFGMHLTPEGNVRKDIDFVIQGINNAELLRQQLPGIRRRLGFSCITEQRQFQQYARYQRVFRNANNSIRSIIARRWTGLQLSDQVVTTIRLRDTAPVLPFELLTARASNPTPVEVSGQVVDADSSNLFPRKFTVAKDGVDIEIYTLWWKFSTPVRDGDLVTLCGNLITVDNRSVVLLTDFRRHWLKIHE
jgi:predicted nucleotidyltransferase